MDGRSVRHNGTDGSGLDEGLEWFNVRHRHQVVTCIRHSEVEHIRESFHCCKSHVSSSSAGKVPPRCTVQRDDVSITWYYMRDGLKVILLAILSSHGP
jgi:hypothetical protein